MRFSSTGLDPLNAVQSVVDGYWFPCPDAATVQRHITDLRKAFFGPHAKASPELQAKRAIDIDRLLDRLAYLETIR